MNHSHHGLTSVKFPRFWRFWRVFKSNEFSLILTLSTFAPVTNFWLSLRKMWLMHSQFLELMDFGGNWGIGIWGRSLLTWHQRQELHNSQRPLEPSLPTSGWFLHPLLPMRLAGEFKAFWMTYLSKNNVLLCWVKHHQTLSLAPGDRDSLPPKCPLRVTKPTRAFGCCEILQINCRKIWLSVFLPVL